MPTLQKDCSRILLTPMLLLFFLYIISILFSSDGFSSILMKSALDTVGRVYVVVRLFGPSGLLEICPWPPCSEWHSSGCNAADTKLRKHLHTENTCFLHVRDGRCLYCAPDDEVLNGLVWGHAPGTALTVNLLHTAVALVSETVVSPLFVHLGVKTRKSPVIIR